MRNIVHFLGCGSADNDALSLETKAMDIRMRFLTRFSCKDTRVEYRFAFAKEFGCGKRRGSGCGETSDAEKITRQSRYSRPPVATTVIVQPFDIAITILVVKYSNNGIDR